MLSTAPWQKGVDLSTVSVQGGSSMAALNRRKNEKEERGRDWERSVEWRKKFLLIYDPALTLHLGLWKINHRHSIVPYSLNIECGQLSVTFIYWYMAQVHGLAQSMQLMFDSELSVPPEWVIGNTLPFFVYHVNGQVYLLLCRMQRERLNMLNNVKSERKYWFRSEAEKTTHDWSFFFLA